MSTESHYLSRVEPPFAFRAPSNEFQFCFDCGLVIMPNEWIAQIGDDDVIHVACLEALREETRDDE